jgi:hypothetical protein
MTNNSADWWQCANEARRLADQFNDPLIRHTLLNIALSYERLAIHAEIAVLPITSERQALAAANERQALAAEISK